jgi:hypothetical protein
MIDQEKALWDRLGQIHRRVQWMADEEARSAWVGGEASRGTLMTKKMRLIEEAEQVLDKIEAMDNA